MGSLAQGGDVPSPSTQPRLPSPCRPRCPDLGLFHPGLLRSFCSPSSSPTCMRSVSPLPWSGGSDDKASACNAGDLGLIPGSGRSPGEGNGNPLQYSCLDYPMDRGAWWATESQRVEVTSPGPHKLFRGKAGFYLKSAFSRAGFPPAGHSKGMRVFLSVYIL